MNTERENMDQLIKQITVQAQTGVHLLFQGAKKEEIISDSGMMSSSPNLE